MRRSPSTRLLVALDAAPEGGAPEPRGSAAVHLAGWPDSPDPAGALHLAVRLAVVSRSDSWDRAPGNRLRRLAGAPSAGGPKRSPGPGENFTPQS
ncbi:hypothetical protein AB2L27_18225 [Kineococcus sp. LSe6-4]|uniref:Uncharacterized protein n=1 Tax=Kineococcus halophytocola TaxID=3234027 RepID=A0ABV4H6H3_9ACTN